MDDKIKLSDYLNYLYNEVVEARKYADTLSIQTAKEYAKDDYLKFFKAPRFTMPSISLEIPIKITELDADVKYEIKMDEQDFLKDINSRIDLANKSKDLKIKSVDANLFKNNDYLKTVDIVKNISRFNKREAIFGQISGLRDSPLDVVIPDSPKVRIGSDKIIDNVFIRKSEDKSKEDKELNDIVTQALLDRNKLVSAKLNNIYIDPNTTSALDKGKILLKMNVELVDEGIRINSVKDEKGQIIEEIIID